MDDYTAQQDPHAEPIILSPREPFTASLPPVRTGWVSIEQAIAAITAVIVTVGVVYVGMGEWSVVSVEEAEEPVASTLSVQATSTPPTQPNPYASIQIGARTAVVYDVYEGKVLYSKDGDKTRPLASLTKLMTSLVALESLDANTTVGITQNAIDTEGDSGLLADERWRLQDLVNFTMVTSSNDGADAIAAAVGGLWQTTPETMEVGEYQKVNSFVNKMNARAGELGLQHMQFYNPTGLDEPNGGAGAVGSAAEYATLLGYVWEHSPEIIAHTDEYAHTFTSSDGRVHTAENTNEYVYTIPGLLGSKTGFTDLAGGNLAILYNAGLDHPIAVVVLGSSKEGRFADVKTLVEATSDYFDTGWYQFEVAGSTVKG